MGPQLLEAIEQIAKEKEIDKNIIIDALEQALISAYRRNFGKESEAVKVEFDQQTGDIRVFALKEVVERLTQPEEQLSLEEAHEIDPTYELGDFHKVEVTPGDFGRVAAQTAKQIVTQKMREAERERIYNHFADREDEIMTGMVERQDARNLYVNLEGIEAVLTTHEQMPNERFGIREYIKVYVTKVDPMVKGSGASILVSRTHPGLLKRLFEIEVPEIASGEVEVKSVAREAGDRSKIAVASDEIDPVGACVGQKGARVQRIVNELNGEKIDIVRYSDDPKEYVANALSPAQVVAVYVNEPAKATIVVVPDFQLSLAIGKRGQNARLAAKLTGWKIDIKSESEAESMELKDVFMKVEPATAEAVDVETVQVEGEE
ncbi:MULTISPECIES: transcription termination factor NusA [Exiguobacterium]|uniref:transcription termination factor NusA n=1 Tax=Exiguobacterium TaxID=33986 RepID=UPI000EED2989|nr:MULTISPECIES: transcription termination factor NusA [Exiguobacterium]MCT4791584.1 transcription termination factor NusA [Exiguobacterium artemiae]MDW2884879.1 transcription termination factor NusA [Exiguobacterium sibiricum]MDX1258624.1 transcription termination factor NusA [Exiguobacterium sp. K1]HCN58033.1 transcription termination/antitermination protein NusA [Exiguobacterium sp.]